MKNTLITFLLCVSTALIFAAHSDIENFKIILEPTWQDLEMDTQKSKEFGGKWVLIGSITFRKKAKDIINLNRLHLKWSGKPITHLLGSLYKKNGHAEFLPIQDNLICDGKWNNAQQILMLDFDQQQTLGLTNIFYVVLTLPQEIESIVREGCFDLVDYCLPEPYQSCLTQEKLSLAISPCIPSLKSMLH